MAHTCYRLDQLPQGDLTRRAADAPARVASVLDSAGEERPHLACHLGPAPAAAVGRNSSTTGRQATVRPLDRASYRPAQEISWRARSAPPGSAVWAQPPGRRPGRGRIAAADVCRLDFPRPYSLSRQRWSRWVCTALLLTGVTTWPEACLHANG